MDELFTAVSVSASDERLQSAGVGGMTLTSKLGSPGVERLRGRGCEDDVGVLLIGCGVSRGGVE